MLGLQALLGFLEVGVLVLVGGRLQVVVHGVGGAGLGGGNCVEGGEGEEVFKPADKNQTFGLMLLESLKKRKKGKKTHHSIKPPAPVCS